MGDSAGFAAFLDKRKAKDADSAAAKRKAIKDAAKKGSAKKK